MKKSVGIQSLLCLIICLIVVSGCAPHPSIKEIGQNRYSISVDGVMIADGDLYQAWEKKASELCNGSYKIIDRQYLQTGDSGAIKKVIGVIECQ